jgi:sulfur carrier protein
MVSRMMVESLLGVTLVKLILRNKEYEVRPGMTLLSALQKIDVIPESVIATRDGEMILDDEILKDGDVVKLIAVISGGSCRCEGDSPKQSPRNGGWSL